MGGILIVVFVVSVGRGFYIGVLDAPEESDGDPSDEMPSAKSGRIGVPIPLVAVSCQEKKEGQQMGILPSEMLSDTSDR